MIKTVLVTGANGQVGNEIRALASQFAQFDFIFTDVQELDLTDKAAVSKVFATKKPDATINCAAYTAVDKAESEPDIARLVNVKAVENLAIACAEHKSLLLHISTDFVYDGTQSRPYIETDAPNPLSVYARTKLEGDMQALALNPATVILRTSWVYSPFGNNFLKTMLRLGAERPKLSVVFDQVGTPTYAADIAYTLVSLLPLITPENYGLYHYSNEGVCSWYDFAWEILRAKGLPTLVLPIESKDYLTPVKRPQFSVLNKHKLKQTFDVSIPHWRESMLKCLERIG